jgi:hypothetical protein
MNAIGLWQWRRIVLHVLVASLDRHAKTLERVVGILSGDAVARARTRDENGQQRVGAKETKPKAARRYLTKPGTVKDLELCDHEFEKFVTKNEDWMVQARASSHLGES